MFDMDVIFNPPLGKPLGHRASELVHAAAVVTYDEAFNPRASHQYVRKRRAIGVLGAVVSRNQPAENDTRSQVYLTQDCVEYLSSRILEVDVDSIWACPAQRFAKLVLLLIDAIVKSEFVYNMAAFFVRAGESHYATTLNVADLAND